MGEWVSTRMVSSSAQFSDPLQSWGRTSPRSGQRTPVRETAVCEKLKIETCWPMMTSISEGSEMRMK